MINAIKNLWNKLFVPRTTTSGTSSMTIVVGPETSSVKITTLGQGGSGSTGITTRRNGEGGMGPITQYNRELGMGPTITLGGRPALRLDDLWTEIGNLKDHNKYLEACLEDRNSEMMKHVKMYEAIEDEILWLLDIDDAWRVSCTRETDDAWVESQTSFTIARAEITKLLGGNNNEPL